MSYAYGDSRPPRNHYKESPSLLDIVVASLKHVGDTCASLLSDEYLRRKRGSIRGEASRRRGWLGKFLSVVLALQLCWVWTVYYSERLAFSQKVNACDWQQWEKWPAGAQPHHVALIADPQLVDPHTYPGRPWPLNALTIWYTDLYLKRVFQLIQDRLYPDSTIFLGDLFDGGREWSVQQGGSWDNPDTEWKGYDEKFWMQEYTRFSRIFFDTFAEKGVSARAGQQDRRRLLAHVPGNHDLGFATGVHLPVRNRFQAYFGDGNRVDIIGNHSFISIDGVSLSAQEHPEEETQPIWQPTVDFLDNVHDTRKRAIASELRKQYGIVDKDPYEHRVWDTSELEGAQLNGPEGLNSTEFPAVLLSHVPLYRDPGTPCGPLRERSPPSRGADGKWLEQDHANAITVQAGYQYQNVLSHDITLGVTTKIGDVQYAFSGDDHDYCNVTHMRYPSGGGGIQEITVKSISWAMGVRKPGFQVVSLWNPVDENGRRIGGAQQYPTLQSHICLLPDQLGFFIRYAMLLVFSLSILLLRAGYMSSHPTLSTFAGSESPLLPVTGESQHVTEQEEAQTSSSDDGKNGQNRRARVVATNGRLPSPLKPTSGYALPSNGNGVSLPLIQHAGYHGPSVDEKQAVRNQQLFVDTRPSKAKRLKGLKLFYAEFGWSVLRVAFVALTWYFWLIWRG